MKIKLDENLLQVEEGDMQWLLFLALFFYHRASDMQSIDDATSSHGAALVS